MSKATEQLTERLQGWLFALSRLSLWVQCSIALICLVFGVLVAWGMAFLEHTTLLGFLPMMVFLSMCWGKRVATPVLLVCTVGTVMSWEQMAKYWSWIALVLDGCLLFVVTIVVERFAADYERLQGLSIEARGLRQAVELLDDAVELTQPNGRISYINPAWESLFGIKKKEAIGMPLDSLLRMSRMEPAVLQSIERAMVQRKVWRGELPFQAEEGERRCFRTSLMGIYQDNELALQVGIRQDRQKEREYEQELRSFYALPDIVFRVDYNGKLLSFKAPHDPDSERSPSVVLGMSLLVAVPHELMPEDIAHRAFQMVRQSLQTNQLQTFEYTLRTPSGRKDYEVRLSPHQSEGEVLVVVRDISEKKKLERALELAQLSFRNIIERNHDGIVIIDQDGVVRFTNQSARRFFQQNAVREGQLFNFPLVVGAATEIDIVRELRDGHYAIDGVGEMRMMPTEWAGDQAYLASIRDITERKMAERRMEHQAYHDLLTGLPNRAMLLRLLESELAREGRASLFGVLFMDLDRFKNVNDSLGHHAGDQLLVSIATRLQRCVREQDIVARLGGDEFVIYLPQLEHQRDAVRVAEQVLRSFAEPFPLRGQDIFMSGSIGIALSSIGYSQPADLLRDSDIAMYKAKEQGKSRYVVFDKTMHLHAQRVLRLENELQKAVEKREFVLYYQPILSLETHRLTGFEVLVRWQHPKEGLIAPGAFIEVAEDTGLIVPIGWWVMREACRQMRVWQLQFPEFQPLTISVNLSARQFAQQDLVDRVLDVLHDTGLPAQSLKLELTESALIGQMDVAKEMLAALRQYQIQVHMDDFGTGYSSLSYLHQFPIDALKIDRSFVSGLSRDGSNAELVKGIVSMAHSLGLSVTAEGAEKDFQIDLLRVLGCERVQGYGVSRPVDAQQATMMVQTPDWYAKQHPVKKRASKPDTIEELFIQITRP
jgi:diguanylate cyclase (GGDEF)-like protein/PAS domain S-box-containing protein